MPKTTFIGCDPGLSGALAFISADGTYKVCDTPTVTIVTSSGKKKRKYSVGDMVILLNVFKKLDVHVAIENVHAMPGQGVTSMFSMGHGLGLWEGIASALEYKLTFVEPKAWKKEFALGSDKNASILVAKQLFPTADITLKKHDGRAEALLIAEWLRRHAA